MDTMSDLGHSAVEGAPVGSRWHGWEGEASAFNGEADGHRLPATGIPMNSGEATAVFAVSAVSGVRESGLDVRGGCYSGSRSHSTRPQASFIVLHRCPRVPRIPTRSG